LVWYDFTIFCIYSGGIASIAFRIASESFSFLAFAHRASTALRLASERS